MQQKVVLKARDMDWEVPTPMPQVYAGLTYGEINGDQTDMLPQITIDWGQFDVWIPVTVAAKYVGLKIFDAIGNVLAYASVREWRYGEPTDTMYVYNIEWP